MSEKPSTRKKGFSPDWLVRGVLTKLGDTFDRLTGRNWKPSSSLATSELIERLNKLLDAEVKVSDRKIRYVPHNIKLRMQWDKFSGDAEDALKKLEHELLAAMVDHINDNHYYTYAPLSLEVKPDYFTEGVKLLASFEKFVDDGREVELDVTVPEMKAADLLSEVDVKFLSVPDRLIARFALKDKIIEKNLVFPESRRLSVGRTGANDLVIDDASVSKIHGSLTINSEHQIMVADTGSTNGTFINDVRIAYGKAVPVGASDKVKFGLVNVELEFVAAPAIVEEETAQEETVAIGEFEFTKRIEPAAGLDDTMSATQAVETAEETIKAPESADGPAQTEQGLEFKFINRIERAAEQDDTMAATQPVETVEETDKAPESSGDSAQTEQDDTMAATQPVETVEETDKAPESSGDSAQTEQRIEFDFSKDEKETT